MSEMYSQDDVRCWRKTDFFHRRGISPLSEVKADIVDQSAISLWTSLAKEAVVFAGRARHSG